MLILDKNNSEHKNCKAGKRTWDGDEDQNSELLISVKSVVMCKFNKMK